MILGEAAQHHGPQAHGKRVWWRTADKTMKVEVRDVIDYRSRQQAARGASKTAC